jgi:SAM-dependent methyltransferase
MRPGRCRTGLMEGYTSTTYGAAFADVYDDWYLGISDADVSADLVVALARESAGDRRPRVVELAAGTGRLTVPIAARDIDVVGVDSSPEMLARLHARDPERRVTTIVGDMVDDLPGGPFDVALVAYNSLFNLDRRERQQACFHAVADRLAPRGRFVVEAFVPEDPPRVGTVVAVRSMTTSEVVLSISEHDPENQRAHGQFVSFVDGERVRLRPWAVRYAPPDELDAMAAAAGLVVEARWEDFDRHPFGDGSPRHVTVYTRRADTVAPRTNDTRVS